MNKKIILIITLLVSVFVLYWIAAGILIPAVSGSKEEAIAVVCSSNLDSIAVAKENWAYTSDGYDRTSPLTWNDLLAGDHLKEIPQCPAGGTYNIGSYLDTPTCSIGNNNTASPSDDHMLK